MIFSDRNSFQISIAKELLSSKLFVCLTLAWPNKHVNKGSGKFTVLETNIRGLSDKKKFCIQSDT